MREELLYRAQALINDDANSDALADGVHHVLLQMMAPPTMKPGPDNAGHLLRAAFEKTCIALEFKGIGRPSELSVYEYYSRVTYLDQQPADKE